MSESSDKPFSLSRERYKDNYSCSSILFIQYSIVEVAFLSMI